MRINISEDGKRFVCIEELLSEIENHKSELISLDSKTAIEKITKLLNTYNTKGSTK